MENDNNNTQELASNTEIEIKKSDSDTESSLLLFHFINTVKWLWPLEARQKLHALHQLLLLI